MRKGIPVAKVRINFFHYRAKPLLAIAKQVSACMRSSPTFGGKDWVGCPTNITNLDAAIVNLDQVDVASKKRDVDVIAQRGILEHALSEELHMIGHYVSMVANGNEQILRESGLPFMKASTKTSSGYTIPTVALRLAHGASGTLLASFTYIGPNWVYRLMVCTGDPTVEENWSEVRVGSRSSRVEVPNREPGTRYFFRVQAIAPDGTIGPWSQTVSIIAL